MSINGKSIKKIMCATLAAVMAAGATQLAACSSGAEHSVSYDPNYDGASVRTVTVAAGAHAVDWQPYRDGYSIEGWYTNKQCTSPFDFDKRIGDDVTLYAYWTKEPDVHRVVFDGNYAGGDCYAIEVESGARISDSAVPDISRIGFDFDGWYKDRECTDKWVFGYDAVTESTTLYAGYSYDRSIPRRADGSPIFDDVNIYVWRGTGHYIKSTTEQLVADFNSQYAGKINVTFTAEMVNQDSLSLRVQQTPAMISTHNAYHCASDIFDLAGLDYDPSLWYEKATQDCYADGKLYQVPLIASVPFIVYNKALMKKYNGDDPLPDSYSKYAALLKEVYDGESTKDPEFKTLVSNRGWTFDEIPSAAPLLQNGAPYYVYENGEYKNEWTEDESKASAATAALENMYSLLGKNGSLHGRLTDDKPETDGNTQYGTKFTLDAVRKGKAFMALANWGYTINEVISDGTVGIMPLSGLYSDGEDKDLIPVHSIGLAFYKAAGVSNTELAAAAVFADWVSKNSWRYGQIGYYPVRKSAAESEEFANNPNGKTAKYLEALKKVGDPNDFATHYGHTKGKTIQSSVGATEHIDPYLDGDSADGAESVIKKLMNVILGQVVI